ncbi:MAG TPA: flavin reductase family protein [Candidatus Methylomirabilis sp.]
MPKIAKKPGTYLYPLPPCLITCGPLARPNIITLAWVGTLCSEPPIIGVSIRPSRYSHALVQVSGEFAVNVPTAEMVRAVDWCGNVSGHSEDKFKAMGLTAVPTQVIHTAVIKECPLTIECRVTQTLHLGTHDLFLGTVVAVQVDEAILDARGQIDLGKANPLAYGGHAYWTLGEFVERQGYTASH